MKTHPIFSSAAFVNKRMKDLFVAQAEKPEELAEVNLTRLTLEIPHGIACHRWNRHAIH